MKPFKLIPILLLLFPLFTPNLVAQSRKADDILGKWLTDNHEAKVEIYKIGNTYYGKIVWLKETNDKETEKPKKDKQNPDPKLRERLIMGMNFVHGFKFDGDDEWEDGTVNDIKSGKTYSGTIGFDDKGKLKLRGYIGKSWMGLGKTTYWTKSN